MTSSEAATAALTRAIGRQAVTLPCCGGAAERPAKKRFANNAGLAWHGHSHRSDYVCDNRSRLATARAPMMMMTVLTTCMLLVLTINNTDLRITMSGTTHWLLMMYCLGLIGLASWRGWEHRVALTR